MFGARRTPLYSDPRPNREHDSINPSLYGHSSPIAPHHDGSTPVVDHGAVAYMATRLATIRAFLHIDRLFFLL
jgi:hypothetical protein